VSNIQLSHVNLDAGNCHTREWVSAPAALTCVNLCQPVRTCADLCGPVRTCAVSVLGVPTVAVSGSLILPPQLKLLVTTT